MEPRPNFHPVYVSGQYLTSEHLNETQNFLWQEEKATRYILAGNGIVQGLQADFTGGTLLQKVSLTTGGAGTIDGYILQTPKNLMFDRGVAITLTWFKVDNVEQIMEKTEFDKIKATLPNTMTFTDLSATELILDSVVTADLPDGWKTLEGFNVTTANALNNNLIIGLVTIKDAENNHCQQGDCNTKGIQRNYNTRYFMLANSLFPQQNTVNQDMPTCFTMRIKNLSSAGSQPGVNAGAFTAWGSSYGELLPYITNTVSNKQLGVIAKLFDLADQNAFTAAVNKFTQINASASAGSCQQYYITFASDLAKAINELVVLYNDYVKKYPSFNASRIERTIIIGSFRITGVDKWRYYFIPAPERVQYQFDRVQLKSHLRRVIAMVNNFILQANINAQAATVAGKPLAIPTIVADDSLLQNRAIPYYYDTVTGGTANEVLQYWNPHNGNLGNIFTYYDSKIPARAGMAPKVVSADWYNYNFFRVEGHLGMTKDAAIAAVNSLIVSQGLPIQLLDCDVNYKGPKKWGEWYDDFVIKLDGYMTNLRKSYKDYDFAPMKNIQNRAQQTSYRDVGEMSKIANDFLAYSSVFHNTKPPVDPKPKAIPGSAYVQFKSVVSKNEMVALYDGFKLAAAEQKDLQSQKLITLKDLYDIEYMGGAPRGGTFVLLHNGQTIIGDGCLAYYYRINSVRVFTVS